MYGYGCYVPLRGFATPNATRERPIRLDRQVMNDAKLTAHLRLFGLLALLVPLFLGLQYVVREGVPRVEVRLVSQDVQTTVPVEVPVERVVERVVYVPVERRDDGAADAGH